MLDPPFVTAVDPATTTISAGLAFTAKRINPRCRQLGERRMNAEGRPVVEENEA
jgi:hypothetical protein